jgi:hypothetical protein
MAKRLLNHAINLAVAEVLVGAALTGDWPNRID